MKIPNTIKIGIIVCAGIFVAMAVQAAQHDMEGIAKANKEYKQKDMHRCDEECVKNCDKNMADLSLAITALDDANKAIDAGDTAVAKTEIAKAKMLLNGIKDAHKKCMSKMPVCNTMCPITGKKIDMMNVTENLTTVYKGQKVGFCCQACPVSWENLTDEEKDAKLEAVKFNDTEKEMMKKFQEDRMQ